MLNELGMNKTIALSALSIIVAIFFAFHIPAEAQEILGYWLFDEGSDEIVKDSSGMRNDGEIQGSCEWVEGYFDGGLTIDGLKGWVLLPNKSISKSLESTNALTMAVWLNPIEFVEGCIQTISEGEDINYFLRIHPSAIEPCIHVGGAWNLVMSDASVKEGNWSHVAATYDGTTLTAYFNGKPGDSIESASLPVGGGLYLGTVSWHLGAGYGSGILDEVVLANYAFTEEELNELMKSGLDGFCG